MTADDKDQGRDQGQIAPFGGEIELTDEDEALLDAVWAEIVAEGEKQQRNRRKQPHKQRGEDATDTTAGE